ncbi:hypothetical protein [Siccirubricoccus phaeus]|uniref:hypothetical protein n=1 Tax=Siccirubricoccus phaeus TaxID=2595053 RepID=UPI0011F2DD0F|nr:hypothetical protein [Siccirubricoccus phaeus]
MDQPEDALAQSERHVREAEGHVAHQLRVIAELDRDNHPRAAALAREVLGTLQRSLELAREHLRLEQEARDLGP